MKKLKMYQNFRNLVCCYIKSLLMAKLKFVVACKHILYISFPLACKLLKVTKNIFIHTRIGIGIKFQQNLQYY